MSAWYKDPTVLHNAEIVQLSEQKRNGKEKEKLLKSMALYKFAPLLVRKCSSAVADPLLLHKMSHKPDGFHIVLMCAAVMAVENVS